MMRFLKTSLITLFFVSSNAFAVDILSKEEIQSEVIGNTFVVDFHHRKNRNNVNYYHDKDGTWSTEREDGSGWSGDWEIRDAKFGGQLCSRAREKWRCSYIKRNKDGNYSRVSINGFRAVSKTFYTSTQVLKGNPLDL